MYKVKKIGKSATASIVELEDRCLNDRMNTYLGLTGLHGVEIEDVLLMPTLKELASFLC